MSLGLAVPVSKSARARSLGWTVAHGRAEEVLLLHGAGRSTVHVGLVQCVVGVLDDDHDDERPSLVPCSLVLLYWMWHLSFLVVTMHSAQC